MATYDPIDYISIPHTTKCKYCGQDGLEWVQDDNDKWYLEYPDGTRHKCGNSLQRIQTITLQIGNSDNKLSKSKWLDYVNDVKQIIDSLSKKVHFFGGSSNLSLGQNAVWVFVADESFLEHIKNKLKIICKKYNQNSVAWTPGKTEFL